MESSSLMEHWRRLERNEEEWYSLWCETTDLQSALIFYNSHFPEDPLYNHATSITTSVEDAQTFIDKTMEIYARRRLNPCFYVSPLTTPKNLSDLLAKKGFLQYDEMEVLEHRGKLPQSKELAGQIVDVRNYEMIEVWCETFVEAFDIPDIWRPEVLRRTSLAASHKETSLYILYLDEKPVGNIAIYSRNRLSGIYCLGTLQTYRGKGVASALISKAITKSKENEDRAFCLQTLSQDRLRAFYESHGFRTAFTRQIFFKPDFL